MWHTRSGHQGIDEEEKETRDNATYQGLPAGARRGLGTRVGKTSISYLEPEYDNTGNENKLSIQKYYSCAETSVATFVVMVGVVLT